MHLSVNAFVARFRSKEYFEEHGYSKGLEVLGKYPGINGQMVIIDSYDLYSYGLYQDGKIVCDIMDYMTQQGTSMTIEKAKITMSSLFI